LAVLWFSQSSTPATSAVKQIITTSVLVAARPIPAGTLLAPSDIGWGDVAATDAGADIVRGSVSDTEFVGAVAQRAFAAHEPLMAAALVKPGDRGFLVAALAPGYRAVSIGVDAAQSTSGLVLPGDRVDIVLTQSFQTQGGDAGHKSVGETVLSDLRVIAVDQALTVPDGPGPKPGARIETPMPKNITFEVTEKQAAQLLVAQQLGKIQLALRGRQDPDASPAHARREPAPTWASDVSQAYGPQSAATGQPQGNIEVMHGAKIERRCRTSNGLVTCQ
jgi:pilus assembly protein CpaB